MNDTGIDLSAIACISIATSDIASLLPAFTAGLGMDITHEAQESPRGFGLRWVEVGSDNKALFELMEPTGTGGPVDKFLENNPRGGVYQVRFLVDDIDQSADELERRGLEVVRGQVVQGVPSVVWVHPRSTGGVLLELLAKRPSE